jgi:hypothetical protein
MLRPQTYDFFLLNVDPTQFFFFFFVLDCQIQASIFV